MVIFKDVVNLVLEAITPGTPPWFETMLNNHKPVPSEKDLQDMFPLLDEPAIPNQVFLNNLKYKKILNVMQNLYDKMTPPPKDWADFKAKTNAISYSKDLEDVINQKIQKAEESAEKEADTKSSVALNTYANNFVIDAVQNMVNKRVDFFTRVAKLKSPTTPFTNLIKDVFSYPEDYLSGNKKFTSDFEGIDNFYISNLINIALAAKNFFVSEVTKLKLGQIQTAGLNLLDIIQGEILKEQTPPSPQQPLLTVDPNIIKLVKSKVAQDIPNRMLFLSGKPITYTMVDPGTGGDVAPAQIKTLDSKQYTVGKIMELAKPTYKNIEAQKLASSLKDVSVYTQKKTGAGERLKYATQAAGAIAGFGGAKLYG